MNTLIEVLPFLVVGCHFIDKYYLSTGRLWPVYIMTIFGSSATALFNVLLYLEQNSTHKSLLLFSVMSLWSISMAIRGIYRLVKHESRSQDAFR